uniref:Secreted peptide n=1 Tax=Anopheles braziliensis TaxID=58242 RepID=A0A2M3ZMD7_9DIPT
MEMISVWFTALSLVFFSRLPVLQAHAQREGSDTRHQGALYVALAFPYLPSALCAGANYIRFVSCYFPPFSLLPLQPR